MTKQGHTPQPVHQETPEWECILDASANIGEAPTWSKAQRVLYWIDIYGPTFNRTNPETGATKTWHMPDPIGSYALHPDERRALIALQSGYYLLDFNTGSLEKLCDAPYDTSNYRFNDGRCDRQGRFWVGTARLRTSSHADGGGAFYRLDPDGPTRMIEKITVANGIAWSPDGRTMYIADRPNWCIWAFDYDIKTGEPSNKRCFAKVPEGEIPDGAAVDSEGGYWIAMMKAGRILRFLPDGTLDRDLKAPTRHPTMVAFGGNDYETLYVTTAGEHSILSEGREQYAGGIFRAHIGFRGLPEPCLSAEPRAIA